MGSPRKMSDFFGGFAVFSRVFSLASSSESHVDVVIVDVLIGFDTSSTGLIIGGRGSRGK